MKATLLMLPVALAFLAATAEAQYPTNFGTVDLMGQPSIYQSASQSSFTPAGSNSYLSLSSSTPLGSSSYLSQASNSPLGSSSLLSQYSSSPLGSSSFLSQSDISYGQPGFLPAPVPSVYTSSSSSQSSFSSYQTPWYSGLSSPSSLAYAQYSYAFNGLQDWSSWNTDMSSYLTTYSGQVTATPFYTPTYQRPAHHDGWRGRRDNPRHREFGAVSVFGARVPMVKVVACR